jgi:hypothetical protein
MTIQRSGDRMIMIMGAPAADRRRHRDVGSDSMALVIVTGLVLFLAIRRRVLAPALAGPR